MFDFPEEKMFMDSVHGYISIPKCFVDNLIDTDIFQRLRNIDQTGMRILYPNAKHDRFSHSLGVYHLGCRAVDTLLNNFFYEDYWKISSDSKSITFWAKNKVLFLIACLLHDIGHTPFSHALEKIVLNNSRTVEKSDGTEQIKKLDDILDKTIRALEHDSDFERSIEATPHEIIGSLYILDNLKPNIERIFDYLIKKNYPFVDSSDILYAEHYNYNPVIDKNDFDKDLAFIVRMILGKKYKNYNPEDQIKNCFIELLNGGNFDVDKLDYVIRDTKMSGISNISIDIERLLNSLCIVTKTKFVDYQFNDYRINERVILKMSGADQQDGFCLEGNFRGTILLKKDSDVTIYKNSTFISFIPTNQGKIKYADCAEPSKFSTNTSIVQDGRTINSFSVTDSNDQYKSLDCKNHEEFDYSITNAEVKSEDFHIVIVNTESYTIAAEIKINGFCKILIKGEFCIKSSATMFDTTLNGKIDDFVTLGNLLNDEIPTKNLYNEFSVGYKKQAINIIANVLEARDYLYLWIYAHHKVMYYANYLIPLISREVLSKKETTEFPLWDLTYNNIKYLDDAYVWTSIKHFYVTKKSEEKNLLNLCEQLLNRKYNISLYKSLAEFDLLFEAIPIELRPNIKSFLRYNISDSLRLDEAGYLKKSIVNELIELSERKLDNIIDIIYISADYRMKRLKADETFILTNDNMIASIDEIPLLSNRISYSTDTSYYFYLYYSTTTEGTTERKLENEIFKKTVQKYFIKNFIKQIE